MPIHSPDTSPILGLPYVLPAQAQKHVTVNTALDRLDALTQLAVTGTDLTAPPAAPSEGDRYIVAVPGAGGWSGQGGQVAVFTNGGWVFYAPRPGWRAWVASTGSDVVWNGTAWRAVAAGEGDPNRLGVGTDADDVNRLAVRSPAALFTHDGDDHRLTINKAGPADTGSVTFQSGWSGRAEVGCMGSDALSVKVSPDGAAWLTALAFDAATGIAGGAAVQDGPTDAGHGRLMATGAFGLGTSGGVDLPGGDLDAMELPSGTYRVASGVAGDRPGGAEGVVTVTRFDADTVFQEFLPVTGSLVRSARRGTAAGGWSAWV